MTAWRSTCCAWVCVLMAACASPEEARPPAPSQLATPSNPLQSAYVIMGPDGVAIARAITLSDHCPSLELDGIRVAMTVRALPATIPLRPTNSLPIRSKPSAFPVLVCETEIAPSTQRAAIGGNPLPLPKAAPQRIVVIGDTGCRIKVSDNVFQSCDDPAKWPFKAVASAAAAMKPDLVIHVGDYHYRENACPEGNSGCAGSPWGFGWDAWDADFFTPARALLAAAPWIMVRGNHEICMRAGQGWWRFLDPRPLQSTQDCNVAANDGIGDFSEPYAVPLGSGSDTQMVVFDSALVPVTSLKPTDAAYAKYRAQFERAFALATQRPNAFFLDHHPILGFAANPAHPQSPYPGNAALQSVLASLAESPWFPPNVQALLSGHNHTFEAVSFRTPHPAQFIAGNAGDWVDELLPSPFPAGLAPAPGTVVDSLISTNRFGFMTMERQGAAWTIVAWNVDGKPMTTCTLVARKTQCSPLALP
jgi:Calcineurin-like phosphoesterase